MDKVVGVVGNGVVGGATGNLFAAKGYEVRYWDIRPDKSTHSLRDVLRGTKAVFVCLPTPAQPDGACDVSVLEEFFVNGPSGDDERRAELVVRSTVPIGFTRRLKEEYRLPNVWHWPEFLNQRTANTDAVNPRLTVLGRPGGFNAGEQSAQYPVYDLLRDVFLRGSGCKLRLMTSDESEAVKLFLNVHLAIKNATFNEFRLLADELGLQWGQVVGAMVDEGRVGEVQTKVPGPDGLRGFGGACLPKDLRSFMVQAARRGTPCHMAHAAQLVNTVVRPATEGQQ